MRRAAVLSQRGNTTPDPSQKVLIPYTAVKLDDLNPLIRNTNSTSSPIEIKVGPSALLKIGSTWHAWFEGVQNTGYPANNGMTAFMHATASVLQGPWTITPSTRVFDAADTTTWEYYELSPASVYWNAKLGRLEFWCHGGNNGGPAGRQGGLVYSTDSQTGLAFARDSRNPLILVGASGAYDDKQAGGDIKAVQNPWTGKWWATFRAQKVGGLTDGTIGRMAGPTFTTMVKTGEVVSTAPSWNAAGGRTSGQPIYDAGGRAHQWYPGGAVGVGKNYTDDDGLTWTDENSGNKVVAPSGTATTYDKVSSGDVVQAILDGDVVFLLYGTENVSDYATNNPLRGASAAIVPFPVVSPRRKGEFYLASAYTTTGATGLLTQTAFTLMGRFRAYRTKRSVNRYIYHEYAAATKEFGVYTDSSGFLNMFYRTPTAIVQITTAAAVDDALWHTVSVRRISTASWEFYVDGSLVNTSVTNPTTDATATTKRVGNHDPAAGGADGPLNGTISDLGIVTGAGWTSAESLAWIANRTLGTGGTVVFDSALNGTDSGNVVQVEAA